MGQQTTPIQPTTFFRQETPPTGAPDGAVWQHPADGAGDDTASRYVYNVVTKEWELDSAVGPSEPTDGTNTAGATWRDTSSGNAKQYDGTEFVNLGVTDHANLDNVASGQHHTKPDWIDGADYDDRFNGTYHTDNTDSIGQNAGNISGDDWANGTVDVGSDSIRSGYWVTFELRAGDGYVYNYTSGISFSGNGGAGSSVDLEAIDVATGDVLDSGSVSGSTEFTWSPRETPNGIRIENVSGSNATYYPDAVPVGIRVPQAGDTPKESIRWSVP